MSSTLDPLNHPRYWKRKALLSDFAVVSVVGPDSESFINAQVTSNIKSLSPQTFQMSSRLDRTGRVVSWFYTVKKQSEEFFFIIPKAETQKLIEDLEKYIIMEEVEIELTDYNPVYFSSENIENSDADTYSGEIFEGRAFLSCLENTQTAEFMDCKLDAYELITEKDLEDLLALHGIPKEMPKNVTSSMLVEYCVDLNKGCFLGQENVAKIINNRGAPFYPVILVPELAADEDPFTCDDIHIDGRKAGKIISKINWAGKKYYLAHFFREFRIKDRTWDITQAEVCGRYRVKYLPFFGSTDSQSIAYELYEYGVEAFHGGDIECAKNFLMRSIFFDPQFADSYESLGVIWGHEGGYEKAINLMNKLLEVDPDSVMAHTNKSLYFMKMGKIEEAEEEKSLATLASFKMFEVDDFSHPLALEIFSASINSLEIKNNLRANFSLATYWVKQIDQFIYLTELLQVYQSQSGDELDERGLQEEFEDQISEEEFFDYWSSGHFAEPLKELLDEGLDLFEASLKLKPLQEETLMAFAILHFSSQNDSGFNISSLNLNKDEFYPLTYHAFFEIGDSTQALHLGPQMTRYSIPFQIENFPFVCIDFFSSKDQILHISNKDKNFAIQANTIKAPDSNHISLIQNGDLSLQLIIGHDLAATADYDPFLNTWRDKTIKACNILKDVSPETYECFKTFTHTLVSNDQEHIVSYSLQDLPYVSTLNMIHRDDIDYLDDLIHENGHHFLNAHLNLNELIHEDDEKIFFSPWRNAKRPIRGLYHAYCTFAWAKVLFASLSSKLIQSSQPEHLLSPYIEKMNDSQMNKIVFRFLEESIMLKHCQDQLKWAYKNDQKISKEGYQIVEEFSSFIDKYKALEADAFEWLNAKSPELYSELKQLDITIEKEVNRLDLR